MCTSLSVRRWCSVCRYRARSYRSFSRVLKKSPVSPAQPRRAETRLFPCGVLGSSKSSTGTRPPHHSAARTDVVLLIRRTVRPRGYASGFDSPAALLYGVLIILRIHRHDVFQSKLLMKGEGGKYVHSREDYEEAAQDGGNWRVDCERGQENEDGAD